MPNQQRSIRDYRSEDLLKAWREGLAEASRSPKLVRQIERYEGKLLPRFVEQYERLRALPRRVRRAVQRKWKHTLAGVALLLALGAGPAQAAIINVNGITCTLVDAITAANNNTATGGCTAGSGADTLVLAQGSTHTLTSVNNTTYGATGLPVISSEITIDGNGSTIRRGTGSPNFRIFAVNEDGNLTLQETTVSGAFLPGLFASGGGIRNSGTVTIANSTISGNRLTQDFSRGGGIFNSGTMTIINSTISGNFVGYNGCGGGIFNSGTITITNSTISRNSASYGLEGVCSYSGTVTLTRTLVSGNSGGEIFNRSSTGSTVTANNFNLFGYSGGSGVTGFSPGATDIVPGVGLTAILNTTLANNGGPTQTHALVSGSPAIDVAGTTCSATDQRGFTRPVDGDNSGTAECDIGSFEFGSQPLLCNGFIVTIFGTGGNDVINGTVGPDIIHGLAGHDTINGLGGDDLICGGAGHDILFGGLGNDVLLGMPGNDDLRGSYGHDTLMGGLGNDSLTGWNGNDNLDGGPGTDNLNGGTGTDTCNGGTNTTSGVDTATACETVTNVP